MPTNDYLVPFGVDPRKFFEGLNQMETGTEQFAANVKQSTAELQKGFEIAATSGDKLGKALDVNAQKAATLRDAAKTVGKAFGDALDPKNVGAGLEDRVNKIKSLITGAGGKGVKLAFDFDEAKLQHFEQMIKNGADEFKILGEVVDLAKQKLATLDPNSAEFAQLNEQIQLSDGLLKAFGQTSDQVNEKDKSLKAQLRALKEELAKMELQGKENTAEFLQQSIAAGKLEDQIGDISQRVRILASDTKYIDAGIQAVTGLAGAFTAAQGATALFGSENENVTLAIQKVTGAMAVLQGIQAVAQALNKDSALSVLFFSKAQQTAAVSTQVMAVAEGEQAAGAVAATAATNAWTASLLANPIFLVIAAVVALVTALIAFTSGNDDAKQAADALNQTLERQNSLLKLDEGNINRRTALLVAYAKQQGKSESDITKIEAGALEQRIKLRRDNLAETRTLLSNDAFLKKLSAEDFKKLQDKELEQTEDYNNLVNELAVKRIDAQTQKNKEAKELEKKRIEDAKKHASEYKAVLEQEIKFRKEFSQAFIDSIADPYEKEKQTLKAQTEQRILALQAEKSLTVKAEQEKNDAIALIRQSLTQQLLDIDHKRNTDRAALLFEGQQKLADLEAEGTKKDLDVLHLGYLQKAKEIKEQFKNEGALRTQLLKALADQEAIETKKIKDAAAINNLQNDEQRAVLEIELSSQFIGPAAKIEEEKQIEILKVKMDYAVRNLNLLRAQGKDENSLEVLQARKTVDDIAKELGAAVKKLNDENSKVDLFKFFGLSNLSEEQKKAVVDAAKSALDDVKQITGFIVDQYQRQIDKKQELIDQENKGISDLENQLSKEKDLRAEGLANNVDTLEAELAAKKDQRDRDLKDQEDLQRKQQAVQRTQILLDTATQASSLITSAANIFKALSSIPFVGVPLAIATIGLMVGAFVTAKIKALQAVGESQKFGEGGWIDGKKHSQGGKKYVATDGSGDVRELEEGEHVTKAKQAEKYGDLLEAINDGRLDRMTEESLRDMLQGMGIHFSDEPREGLRIVQERESLKHEVLLMPGNDITSEVKNINENVSFLAAKKKTETQRWEDDKFYYEKSGSKTTKIPKK